MIHVADIVGRPGATKSCHEDKQGSTDDPYRRGSTPGQQRMCEVPAVARRGASKQADGQIGSHTWRKPEVCFWTKTILDESGVYKWTQFKIAVRQNLHKRYNIFLQVLCFRQKAAETKIFYCLQPACKL